MICLFLPGQRISVAKSACRKICSRFPPIQSVLISLHGNPLTKPESMSDFPSYPIVTNEPEYLRSQDSDYIVWRGDVEGLLDSLPETTKFDLIVTSPPYNIGKEYESKVEMEVYLEWQRRIIGNLVKRLTDTGSICWQVGNFVKGGEILPLDMVFHPIFQDFGLKLRNRIVWTFGHGLHSRRRFSGRYEVVLWYTAGDKYKFNLDAVRRESKYPGKKHYKGPNKGKYSSHPKGKNPEDVWNNIPNVKSSHIEKTEHPCQFPVGLIERLVLALTDKGDLVFDPFAGVGSAGVAAAIHGRRFWGAEISEQYVSIAQTRISDAIAGQAKYRPHDKPLYDHRNSKMSVTPARDT